MARHGVGWWLLPITDFVCSSLALLGITLIALLDVFPAFPVAPLILVFVYALLGVYGARPGRGAIGAEGGIGWPVARLLVGALFAWSASLLTPFAARTTGALRRLRDPRLRRAGRGRAIHAIGQPIERWVLVGDVDVATGCGRTRHCSGRAVVASVEPLRARHSAGRARALEVIEQHDADRVVISTEHADDGGLLGLVRAFKAVGVPVSMLPRPLDLLEAPAARPTRVGGVPLIEVESLAARDSLPYKGPDRRDGRRTARISVVVPAMNEAETSPRSSANSPTGCTR